METFDDKIKRLEKEAKDQKEILELTQRKLTIALKLNDELEKELKKYVPLQEKEDPAKGPGPLCESVKLHRAEICKSMYTKTYKREKAGDIHLCTHHAKILIGK